MRVLGRYKPPTWFWGALGVANATYASLKSPGYEVSRQRDLTARFTDEQKRVGGKRERGGSVVKKRRRTDGCLWKDASWMIVKMLTMMEMEQA